MILHTLHTPKSSAEHIAAPRASAGGPECGYCHRPGVPAGTQCPRCGVWMPSEWKRPSRGQKPAAASRAEYWPRHDGEIDHGPQAIRYPGDRADDPGDELAEYRELLAACHDPAADELEDPCDPANWTDDEDAADICA